MPLESGYGSLYTPPKKTVTPLSPRFSNVLGGNTSFKVSTAISPNYSKAPVITEDPMTDWELQDMLRRYQVVNEFGGGNPAGMDPNYVQNPWGAGEGFDYNELLAASQGRTLAPTGGGGATGSTKVEWGAGNYKAFGPNIPDWWKALSPKNKADLERPDVQFAIALNAMIPYLSPEDQISVARNLYTTWGEGFNAYKDIGLAGTSGAGKAPVSAEQSIMGIEGAPINQAFFEGPGRSDLAKQTLESVRGGEGDLGSGGRFLETILNAIGQTGGRQSRASTINMLGQLDPLLGSASSGELSPYGPLGSMVANPFFSRFNMQPVSKTQAGNYLFGSPSKWLNF